MSEGGRGPRWDDVKVAVVVVGWGGKGEGCSEGRRGNRVGELGSGRG